MSEFRLVLPPSWDVKKLCVFEGNEVPLEEAVQRVMEAVKETDGTPTLIVVDQEKRSSEDGDAFLADLRKEADKLSLRLIYEAELGDLDSFDDLSR